MYKKKAEDAEKKAEDFEEKYNRVQRKYQNTDEFKKEKLDHQNKIKNERENALSLHSKNEIQPPKNIKDLDVNSEIKPPSAVKNTNKIK